MESLNIDENSIFLITGVAGFIGSNLAEKCLELGYRVRGIDNFSNGSKKNIIELIKNDKFEFIEGDICDFEVCNRICKSVNYVFHEAAWGSVPKSIEQPLNYTFNNIVGTHNMLHASYLNNIKVFIYASSASVYGDNRDKIKVVEKTGNILSPYALSKKTDEDLAKLYYELYGLNTIGLRYFNVFGKRQNSDSEYSAVIPKFIKAILQHKEIIINGDGNQSRDFTYIENVVDANLKSCSAPKEAFGKVFNVACGNTTSIIELYNIISRLLNKKTIVKYGDERKGDIRDSLADIEPTRNILNYYPKYDLIEGLKRTVDWYSKN